MYTYFHPKSQFDEAKIFAQHDCFGENDNSPKKRNRTALHSHKKQITDAGREKTTSLRARFN